MRIHALLALLALACSSGCVENHIYPESPRHCGVHDKDLQKTVVPIAYGMSGGYEFAGQSVVEQELFPNANSFVSGGCIVGLREEYLIRGARVLSCLECVAAEKAWLKTARLQAASNESAPAL